MKYLFQFDKMMLDGALAGFTLPGEYIASVDRGSLERSFRTYCRVEQADDFMRDCASGNRFKVRNVTPIMSIGA
jgi:hypothetical protein